MKNKNVFHTLNLKRLLYNLNWYTLVFHTCLMKRLILGYSLSLQGLQVNPFTPKSDQCQIPPAASPRILHHTVGRTWLVIAYKVDR